MKQKGSISETNVISAVDEDETGKGNAIDLKEYCFSLDCRVQWTAMMLLFHSEIIETVNDITGKVDRLYSRFNQPKVNARGLDSDRLIERNATSLYASLHLVEQVQKDTVIAGYNNSFTGILYQVVTSPIVGKSVPIYPCVPINWGMTSETNTPLSGKYATKIDKKCVNDFAAFFGIKKKDGGEYNESDIMEVLRNILKY